VRILLLAAGSDLFLYYTILFLTFFLILYIHIYAVLVLVGQGSTGGGRSRRGRSGSHSSGSAELDSGHPPCRLSRPGSSIVRVIPPLRGLERQFKCSWCNTYLFTTANVLRTDLDVRHLLNVLTCAIESNGLSIAPAKYVSIVYVFPCPVFRFLTYF
jgi:hypothetical protein